MLALSACLEGAIQFVLTGANHSYSRNMKTHQKYILKGRSLRFEGIEIYIIN